MKKKLFILFCVAFMVRAVTFFFFMQQTTRDHIHYQQPDSADYHNGAICMAMGNGMSMPGSNQPIFWRTPGYPLFLSFFYNWFGLRNGAFDANHSAQKAALWVQLLLCSLIPIIVFYLAYLLTSTYFIAWLTAWIFVFHVGQILASTYLLTEGISMIFFYLFLIYFYRLLLRKPAHPEQGRRKQKWFFTCIMACAMLSLYTWIRPMGEFVGVLSTVMIVLFSSDSWRRSIQKGLTFSLPFFASLFPWYLRNYQLTGQWFYCPLSGIYLNAFCAPKILRRTMNITLNDAWKYTQRLAQQEVYLARQALRGTGMFVSPLLSKKIALPILLVHPFYFMFDWIKEALKTTFDLYASQLVSYAKGQFWFDPLEEFLSVKIAECLWAQPMPIFMRLICWTEFLFSVALWFGLLGGLWVFVLRTFWRTQTTAMQRMRWLWLMCGIMIGAVLGMTGGFGYARLRLPVEPLMIILSLTFWYWLLNKNREQH